MIYPSKNGRLWNVFGFTQSEGAQPIFLFTISYTTSCPRNDISVKVAVLKNKRCCFGLSWIKSRSIKEENLLKNNSGLNGMHIFNSEKRGLGAPKMTNSQIARFLTFHFKHTSKYYCWSVMNFASIKNAQAHVAFILQNSSVLLPNDVPCFGPT